MKLTQSFALLGAALANLASIGAANLRPHWLPERDTVLARQASHAASADPASSSSTGAAETATPTSVNLNTATAMATTDASDGNSSNGVSMTAATHTTYDAQSPAGGVTMLTPAPAAGTTQLYRIGEFVTWGWNYTSLQATPTAIDLLISCSAAAESWVLTNMSFASPGTYTWDTGAFQSANSRSQLPVDIYTLILFDADSSESATAEAGYLSVYSAFQFGLYTSKPYTDIGSYVCATCSGALSDMDRRVVNVAILSGILCFLSFTWFAVGFGGVF